MLRSAATLGGITPSSRHRMGLAAEFPRSRKECYWRRRCLGEFLPVPCVAQAESPPEDRLAGVSVCASREHWLCTTLRRLDHVPKFVGKPPALHAKRAVD